MTRSPAKVAAPPVSTRVSLAEAIARELEAEITGGSPGPGQRIGTKDELRRRFGVAAATINEAVRLVERRGLLVAKPGPGGGIFVADTSARVRMNQFVLGYRWSEGTVADFHALRNALEALVCRDAAAHRRKADVRELRQALVALEGTLDDPVALLRQTWALHRRIAQICHNAPLHSVYLTVVDFLEDAVERVEFGRSDAHDYFDRHVELVAAIDEGPGPRLEAAIVRHEAGIRPQS
jgi:DNA-binding FadR family transcriptional regulator